MPSELETRLESLTPGPAGAPPAPFLAAVARRRRARTLQVLAPLAVLLLAAPVVFVSLRTPRAHPRPAIVHLDDHAPTIAAIYAANPDLTPETLRLPDLYLGGAIEPIRAHALGSSGG
jgi:hypothetical protein